MKKNLLTIMLAFFVAFGVNAQDFGAVVSKSNKVDLNTTVLKTTMQAGLRSGKAVFLSETFDADIPAGWTIVNNGDGPGWLWTAGTPFIDSDAAGSGVHESAELQSPVTDVTAATTLTLAFDSYYNNISVDEIVTLDVYDGSAWVTLEQYTADHGASGALAHFEYDVTSYINANFQVRFNYDDGNAWAWYWYIDNVSVFEAEPHDLGVDAVTPTFVLSGETVTPQVTVHNYGSSDEATWSVQLTDGAGYDNTVADAATITAGSDYVIDFADFTPADGAYTLTATVTVAGDANAANDVLAVDGTVAEIVAFTGNASAGLYQGIDLATGALMDLGALSTADFPMAEEFDGTTIYRVTAGADFGTVDIDGTYTSLGALTGFTGTPTGLAWDWANETMYVMMLDAGNLANLCTLDIGTLVLTQVGGAGTAMTIAIDFANDGYIYGPSIGDENLYQYDPATGVEVLIGATGLGLNYGQDVSFDAVDGLLYTINCGDQYTYGTYDITTGAFTEIADMGGNQHGTFVITKDATVSSSVTFNVDIWIFIGVKKCTVGDFKFSFRNV